MGDVTWVCRIHGHMNSATYDDRGKPHCIKCGRFVRPSFHGGG